MPADNPGRAKKPRQKARVIDVEVKGLLYAIIHNYFMGIEVPAYPSQEQHFKRLISDRAEEIGRLKINLHDGESIVTAVQAIFRSMQNTINIARRHENGVRQTLHKFNQDLDELPPLQDCTPEQKKLYEELQIGKEAAEKDVEKVEESSGWKFFASVRTKWAELENLRTAVSTDARVAGDAAARRRAGLKRKTDETNYASTETGVQHLQSALKLRNTMELLEKTGKARAVQNSAEAPVRNFFIF